MQGGDYYTGYTGQNGMPMAYTKMNYQPQQQQQYAYPQQQQMSMVHPQIIETQTYTRNVTADRYSNNRKNKYRNMSSRRYDDENSTDESIHLIRSRKTGGGIVSIFNFLLFFFVFVLFA
jgi:hypothetical protein